ncbi:hypothetical protein RI054_03g14840 [Pseudoscourfieldia marina]
MAASAHGIPWTAGTGIDVNVINSGGTGSSGRHRTLSSSSLSNHNHAPILGPLGDAVGLTDDAVDGPSSGLTRKAVVVLGVWSGFVAIGLHAGAFGPTLPALAARAGVGENRMSASFLIAGVAAAFFTPLIGALSDRIGVKTSLRAMLSVALFVDATGAAAQPRMAMLVRDWPEQYRLIPLAVLWSICGMSISTVISVGNACAVSLFPPDPKDEAAQHDSGDDVEAAPATAPPRVKSDALYAAVAALGCGYSIGNALATAGAGDAGIAVLDQASAILATSATLVFVLSFLLPERDEVASGVPSQASSTLSNESTLPLLAAEPSDELAGNPMRDSETRDSTKAARKCKLIDLGLALSLMFSVMVVGSEISFGSWVGSAAVHACDATPRVSGALGSTFWIAYTFGRMIFLGAATRGYSPWTALAMSYPSLLVGLGIGASMIFDARGVWKSLHLPGDGCFPLYVGAALYGIGRSAGFISICAIVGKRKRHSASKSATAMEQALVGCAGSIGAAALPCLVGALGGQSGDMVGKSLIVFVMGATAIELISLTALVCHGIDVRENEA